MVAATKVTDCAECAAYFEVDVFMQMHARHLLDTAGPADAREYVEEELAEYHEHHSHSCRWCPHDWTGKGEG